MLQLETKHLNFSYHDHQVLKEIDIQIPVQKISVILGANGCGKSTLLKNMCKVLKPNQGTVLLDHKNIWKYPSRQLATHIGLMPQSSQTPEGITVLELVSRGRFPYRKAFRSLSKEDHIRIQEAMAWMKITDIAQKPVDELSGGQRQRVYMALALAQDTEVLFLDEPTTFLDVQYQIEILDLLWELNQKKHTSIVMVLHDINLAARYSHHIFALKDGKVKAQGTPQEVITESLIKEIYGIDCRILTDPYYQTPLVLPLGKYAREDVNRAFSL